MAAAVLGKSLLLDADQKQYLPGDHEEANTSSSTDSNNIGNVFARRILLFNLFHKKCAYHNPNQPHDRQVFLCNFHYRITK